MGRMRETALKEIETVRGYARQFKHEPAEALGNMIPVAMVALSVAAFAFSIASFALSGSFSDQADLVFAGDVFDFSDFSLTYGNSTLLTEGLLPALLVSMMVLHVATLGYLTQKTGSRNRFVAVWVLMGVAIASAGPALLLILDYMRILPFPAALRVLLYGSATDISEAQRLATVAVGYTIIAAFAISVTAIVALACRSGYRRMVASCVKAAVVSFAVLPLLLLLVENAVPLFRVALALIALAFVCFVGLMLLAGGGADSSSSTPEPDASSAGKGKDASGSTLFSSSPAKPKKKDFCFRTEVWLDDQRHGILHPGRSIMFRDVFGGEQFACSAAAFEKGDYQIYILGKRVWDIPGCKRPER